MKWPVLSFMLFVLTAGCAHVPFQETPLVSFETRDPRSVVERFQARTPGNFQLLTTVVFEYNGRTFPGIGTVAINAKARAFTVAGLNAMGVKLFELSGDDHSITTRYVLAALAVYGDIGTTIGNDIKRIYFDLAPSPDASLWRRKYQFHYRQFSGTGSLEYIFAGPEGDLIAKRYYEDHQLAWEVLYYEYREQNGKRFPQGIVLVNYQYGYRLTVRQKELYS